METIENIITLQVCLCFTCTIYPRRFHWRMICMWHSPLNTIPSGHIRHWFEVGGAAHWRHPLCFPGTVTGLSIDFSLWYHSLIIIVESDFSYEIIEAQLRHVISFHGFRIPGTNARGRGDAGRIRHCVHGIRTVRDDDLWSFSYSISRCCPRCNRFDCSRTKPYLPQICGTILWRLNNKAAKVRQQAADLVSSGGRWRRGETQQSLTVM